MRYHGLVRGMASKDGQDRSLSWAVEATPDGTRISLRGAFDETSDFSAIDLSGGGQVVFDTAAVRLINSWGARQWIRFLRAIPEGVEFCFVNASTVFIKHCNMVTDMLGRGSIMSFAAPYACDGCERSSEHLLQVAELSGMVVQQPPQFRCPDCGGVERLDEMPARYFAFMGVHGAGVS